VRDGKVFRKLGPFEAKNVANVTPELDRIVSCRRTLATMAVTPDSIEREQIIVEPRDRVPRNHWPTGWAAP